MKLYIAQRPTWLGPLYMRCAACTASKHTEWTPDRRAACQLEDLDAALNFYWYLPAEYEVRLVEDEQRTAL